MNKPLNLLAASSVAALALAAGLGASPAEAGSTWAVVHGTTYAVSAVAVHGNTTTWALTPVKKGAVPAGTKWYAPTPTEINLGFTRVAGTHLMQPTSIKLG